MIVFIGIIAYSCNNKFGDTPDPEPTTDMQNMSIADGFNFENTKDVELEIKLPSHMIFTNQKSRIDIYYLNGDEKNLISSVSCDDKGEYKGSIRIPAFINEIVIENVAGEITKSLEAASSLKSAIIIDFDSEYSSEEPQTAPENESALKNEFTGNSYGGVISYLKATANIIGNGTFDDNDFGSITNWNSALVVDQKWHITSQLNGYVTQADESGNKYLKITRPASYRYGGVAQLVNASPGDRITFSADIRIQGSGTKRAYLYIIPRRSNGSPIAYYSRTVSSTGNTWRNYSVAANMPNGTASCEILLWNHIYGGEINYDNVIVTGPVLDQDNDGVNDDEDEYPNDSERAFNSYYPSNSTYTSIAFEDNWPGRGDYDFNDLVVDCRYKRVLNSSNALKDLDVEIIYKAAGATLENGFGFEVNTPPANVVEVTGQTLTKSYITLLGTNKPEAGQAKATFIATDNVFNKLNHPGSGIGVNTTPGATYVEPVTQNIHIEFQTAVSVNDAGLPPYNPFMIVNGDRGREIHLPDYTPTSLANQAYFGTQHDDTQIGTKYYKTSNNLPWAINIPVSFDYPNEKVEVIKAHLKFQEWAESAGSLFPDWYLDNSGYRNSGNIYVNN